MDVLGATYANMLFLLKHLDLLVHKENIALRQITWTAVSTMLCIFFHAKHVLNNTQVVRKVFDLYLRIISQPIRISGNTVKEASFHAHFEDVKHHGMSDWEINLVDQAERVDDLRRRESFWQYELNAFQPNGLNEPDVALFWRM